MHVVVLQRPNTVEPFDRWILEASPAATVTVVSGVGALRSDVAAGAKLVQLPNYGTVDALGDIFQLCARERPDRIFTNTEDDVLSTAEIRTMLGIPGQRSDIAMLFRDKVLMKTLFQDAGIPAVPYRAVRSVADVLSAFGRFGRLVVKPRWLTGSFGVQVFASAAEILSVGLAQPGFVRELHEGKLLAEPYIEGTVYHVDVAVCGGRPVLISPSQYTAAPHLFRTENLGSVMVDLDSAVGRSLTEICREFVDRLPAGHEVSVLHLEFYLTPAGELLAGEVGCRLGGGEIRAGIRHTYQVDPARLACLISTGLWDDDTEITRSGSPTAWILGNGGPELSLPAGDHGWVLEHSEVDRPHSPFYSTDAKARFLIEGADESQLRDRLGILAGRVPATVPGG